jgi:hypothetical protein
MDNMIDIKDCKADLSDIKIENLLDLSKTDAAPLFEGKTCPFEILPEIKGYITDVLIPSLDKAEFEQRGENVFVAKSAKIAASAVINGPTVIFPDAEIRPGAFIRGSAIVGRAAVVGNSTELKNCVLFDGVQVPNGLLLDTADGYHFESNSSGDRQHQGRQIERDHKRRP